MNKEKIVVCGATGNQGRAVAQKLVQSGKYEVIALSRNPESATALQLQQIGATILKADTRDKLTLLQAFKGAYGVFGVTQPWSADYKKCDVENELLQAKNIIDACKVASVKHLVFSSIINLDNLPTGVTHVDSKLEIEQMIKDSKLAYTVVRCSQFMDNIGAPFFPVKDGKVKGFVAAEAKVPYIACADIGNAANEAFCNPEPYLFRIFDLIGDLVSGKELAMIFEELTSKKHKYTAPPGWLLRLFAPEFFAMRRWFERSVEPQQLLKTLAAMAKSKQVFDIMTMQEYLAAAGYAKADKKTELA